MNDDLSSISPEMADNIFETISSYFQPLFKEVNEKYSGKCSIHTFFRILMISVLAQAEMNFSSKQEAIVFVTETFAYYAKILLEDEDNNG